MEKLNNEEYEYLKKYEDRLITASGSNYARAIPSGAVHKMREIYSRLIGQTYAMNESCGACVLTLCKKLYPPYKQYDDEIKRNSTRRTSKSKSDSGKTITRKVETGNTERTEE